MIRIGTRGSRLALAQTELAVSALKERFPGEEISVVTVSTGGDADKDRPLDSFVQKGVFTREIDELLLSGEIDIAVHSSKDMAPEMPSGVIVAAVLEREDPGDVFITLPGKGCNLKDMPEGSVIGTSSGRRAVQAKKINPDIRTEPIRGNVPTRIRKLREGMYDGIILALAGLKRLGLTEDPGISIEVLDTHLFIPGAGQGIIALAVRQDDKELINRLKLINHVDSYLELACERTFLKITGGGCKAPCGILTRIREDKVHINAFVEDRYLSLEGVRDEAVYLASQAGIRLSPVNVSLVGAGPYRADLISEAGKKRLTEADVVIYDDLTDKTLLSYAPSHAELIYAGKRSGKHYADQDEINNMLVTKAKEGGRVVRLKGGDPFIFGRGGEEALALRDKGIRYEIIPGISSSYSVPELLGVPVTHRGLSSSVSIITGHRADGASEDNGTRVYMMGRGSLRRIVSDLADKGFPADTPAMVIQNGASNISRYVTGILSDIADKADRDNIGTPALIVTGDTVRLADAIMPDHAGLLHGTGVILTGSSYVSSDIREGLDKLGAHTQMIPLIRTGTVSAELPDIKKFSYIVFLSRQGVRSFFDNMLVAGKDIRELAGIGFAAVGRRTEEELMSHGIKADIVPAGHGKERLAEVMIPRLSAEDRVMIVRSFEERDILNDSLDASGIYNETVRTYVTVHDMRLAEDFVKNWENASYVTVTSSSNARAVAEALGDKRSSHEPVLVSMGTATTDTLMSLGFKNVITCRRHDDKGIIQAILNDMLDRTGGIL